MYHAESHAMNNNRVYQPAYTKPRSILGDLSNRTHPGGPSKFTQNSTMGSALKPAMHAMRNVPSALLPSAKFQDPSQRGFLVTPTTCVPSLLHSLGLSQYSANLMEHGVYMCGQLYAMPYESLRPFVASDEHCRQILGSLHPPQGPPYAVPRPEVLPPPPLAPMATTTTRSPSPEPSPSAVATGRVISSYRNDPYSASVVGEDVEPSPEIMSLSSQRAASRSQGVPAPLSALAVDEAPFMGSGLFEAQISPVLPPELTPIYPGSQGQSPIYPHGAGMFSRNSSMTMSNSSFLLGPLKPSLDDTFALQEPTMTFTEVPAAFQQPPAPLPVHGMAPQSVTASPEPAMEPIATAPTENDPSATAVTACTCLIHFKFRQTEYRAPFLVKPGQYVMVAGDRGQDLGLVIRVNTEDHKGYVERTGPQGTVSRAAYQKEVDYFHTGLRADELGALNLCRAKIQRLGLVMDVQHAEFQYDKKKLTFYYESRARVDFVALLKDLYREFGCRIWMEKVPRNNVPMAEPAAEAEEQQ